MEFPETMTVQQTIHERDVKENTLTNMVKFCRCREAFDEDRRFSAAANKQFQSCIS